VKFAGFAALRYLFATSVFVLNPQCLFGLFDAVNGNDAVWAVSLDFVLDDHFVYAKG
jgi:hypothetical protein